MALLVGELFARITSDSSQFKRDMDDVDRKGDSSAKKAEANALKIAAARKAEMDAAGKARVAQAALDELREKGKVKASSLAAAEERLAAAHRGVAEAQAKTAALLRKDSETLGDAIGDGVVKGLRQKASEDKLRKALKLTNAAGWVAQGGILGAGLGAGVVAGMVGVASTAVPIALAALLLKDSERLQTAYNGVFDQVIVDAKGFAGVLEGPLLQASDDLSASWTRMAPTVKKMFDDAVPSVEHLTRGVTGLAEEALPGLGRAVSRSEPIMVGFERMMIRTGTGVGAFFDNSTRHSIASGQILEHFGVLAEKALGGTGNLLDKLTTAYAPHTAAVEQFFGKLGTVLGSVADGALPMLADSMGTTLKVFSAALSVVAPFADELGTVLGVVLPLYSGFKLLNTVLSPFEKLMGSSVAGGFSKAGKGSDGLLGKLTALAGTAGFGAVGGAALATGAILGTYYMEQRKVQQGAEEYAQGLLQGGEAARKVTNEYAGQSKALGELTAKRDAWNKTQAAIEAGADDAIGSRMNDQIMAQNQVLDEKRKKYDELHASLGPLGQRQLELNKAVAEFGPTSAAATSASEAYRRQKDADTASELALQRAIETSNSAYINRQNTLLGAATASVSYRGAVLNADEALRVHNETVTKHGAGSREAANSLIALEAAELTRINATREATLATTTATDEESKKIAATAAATAEILKMAAATNGVWTPSMQTAMGQMSATELATIGVTRSVNEAGQAVYRLPNGKTVTITADTQAAKDRLAEIEKYQIRDKFFTVTMRQVVDVIGTPIAGSNRSDNSAGGFNKGGWVPGEGPDRDSVPTVLTPKEFVVNRKASARYGPFLEAINKAAGGDVKMPTPMLATAPMPTVGVPTQAATQAASLSRGASFAASGSDGGTSGGRTIIIKQLVMNQVKSLPTAQELRNVLHDVEVQYG